MNQAIKRHLLALFLFTIVAILMTLPVVSTLTTHVAGVGGDPWQTMWRFENQAEQLTDAGFWRGIFGGGEPRLVNYSTMIWMPMHLVFKQPATYNLVWLLSFILAGYFMYLLARYLLQRYTTAGEWLLEFSAGIAGLYYMFSPFHAAHAFGHFGAMQLQWIPLLILLVLRLIEKPSYKLALAAAVIALVQLWTEHHYLIWLLLFFVIVLIAQRKRVVEIFKSKEDYKPLLLADGIFFGIAAITYWPTIRLAFSPAKTLALGTEQAIRFSADLFGYIVPATFHPIWGGLISAYSNFTGNVSENTHYLGIAPLLLIIFFQQRIPRVPKLFWWTVALIFLLLSLGPRLHVLGFVSPIPLPFALIDQLPVLSAIRAVGRAGVMVVLSIAVLLAFVVASQFKRQLWARLLTLIIVLDFLFLPIAVQSVTRPQVYDQASKRGGEKIIEIPAATNYGIASRSLYFASKNDQEAVGNIALERAFTGNELLEATSYPILRQLIYLRTGHLQEFRNDFLGQEPIDTLADTLTKLGVNSIVLHKDSLSVSQEAVVETFLEKAGLSFEVVGDANIYDTTVLQAAGDGVFATRDDGWQVAYDANRDTVFAELAAQGQITMHSLHAEEIYVELAFTVAPESHGSIRVMSAGEQVVDLNSKGGEQVTVELKLQPGSTDFTFRNHLPQKAIIMDPSLNVL